MLCNLKVSFRKLTVFNYYKVKLTGSFCSQIYLNATYISEIFVL